MSFIGETTKGKVYAAGWFLAHAECERKTRQFSQSGATTTSDGKKYWKMGSVYPSNNGNAVGIVYEDVDVTTGDMPGSVVLNGVIYEDRLAVALDASAKTALEAKGFTFKQSPAVARGEE